MKRVKKAIDESGQWVNKTLPRSKSYANGGTFGKRDRLPFIVLGGLFVVLWLGHDILGVALPSTETLDTASHIWNDVKLPLGLVGGAAYARRTRP